MSREVSSVFPITRKEKSIDQGAETAVSEGRRFAPSRQRNGIHAGTRLFAEHREILAQVEAGPQFVDRPIARANYIGRRRRQQPTRQSVLPDVRTRGA